MGGNFCVLRQKVCFFNLIIYSRYITTSVLHKFFFFFFNLQNYDEKEPAQNINSGKSDVELTEDRSENLEKNKYNKIQNDNSNNSINLNKKNSDKKKTEKDNPSNLSISCNSKNEDQIEEQKKSIDVSSMTISDVTENNVKEESINTKTKSKTSSNKLIKSINFAKKSKTSPDILHKNTNKTNKMKTTFSDKLYEKSKNKIEALKTIYFDKSFSLYSNVFSTNNKGSSDDFFKNNDYSIYSSEYKALPIIGDGNFKIKLGGTKKLIFEKHKTIKRLAYSLDTSRYNYNENKKLPLKKCNSTYFNKRGIAISF
ncbi:hypothetical protein PRELSG_0822800 [Plasmodium relictum]|uniref:Uncharacterized protein n=1 Tax=Plasmodium relictum TaxID=85471 RepID=A0A1J1H4X5_PLARL|nr:hypothetical protein PRELSG_0822800 [Plasmodium relictum]CRG99802.1 hypothetical protein PRELSG_0822800 [Plasmodium relictum]